jgi:hypothetical protein
MATQYPIIIEPEPDKWICVTKYHATSRGNLFIEEAHDITDRIVEITDQEFMFKCMNVGERRN